VMSSQATVPIRSVIMPVVRLAVTLVNEQLRCQTASGIPVFGASRLWEVKLISAGRIMWAGGTFPPAAPVDPASARPR
jgi:hypothetical protein